MPDNLSGFARMAAIGRRAHDGDAFDDEARRTDALSREFVGGRPTSNSVMMGTL
jgi:hypothetical protein